MFGQSAIGDNGLVFLVSGIPVSSYKFAPAPPHPAGLFCHYTKELLLPSFKTSTADQLVGGRGKNTNTRLLEAKSPLEQRPFSASGKCDGYILSPKSYQAEVQTSVRGGADNGLNRAPASEPARQAPAVPLRCGGGSSTHYD